ncbi:MAG: DUF2017 family protein [Micrococcales bacterium]|nr:DUF2017 family protein [Micrococcales bacterium]
MSGASVDRGRILVDLDAEERRLLGGLLQTATDALIDTADPARARLLPDGYRGDADAAAEFARYTRDDTRRDKLSRIGGMRATLDAATAARIPLDHEDADAWARVLTDVRVVVAERAGIRTDDDVPADPVLAQLYGWLGHLQWSLVEALDRVERKGRRGRRL